MTTKSELGQILDAANTLIYAEAQEAFIHLAGTLAVYYKALLDKGFSEEQAMVLTVTAQTILMSSRSLE